MSSPLSRADLYIDGDDYSLSGHSSEADEDFLPERDSELEEERERQCRTLPKRKCSKKIKPKTAFTMSRENLQLIKSRGKSRKPPAKRAKTCLDPPNESIYSAGVLCTTPTNEP